MSCEICTKKAHYQCSSCHGVFYCSEKCQKRDWFNGQHGTKCNNKNEEKLINPEFTAVSLDTDEYISEALILSVQERQYQTFPYTRKINLDDVVDKENVKGTLPTLIYDKLARQNSLFVQLINPMVTRPELFKKQSDADSIRIGEELTVLESENSTNKLVGKIIGLVVYIKSGENLPLLDNYVDKNAKLETQENLGIPVKKTYNLGLELSSKDPKQSVSRWIMTPNENTAFQITPYTLHVIQGLYKELAPVKPPKPSSMKSPPPKLPKPRKVAKLISIEGEGEEKEEKVPAPFADLDNVDYRNIEKETIENSLYRNVVYTAPNGKIQLVEMNLTPGETIPAEIHENVQQFIRIEKGRGKCIITSKDHVPGRKTLIPSQRVLELSDGISITIPSGTQHEFRNDDPEQDLKLYSIYAPAEHERGKKEDTQPKTTEGK